MDVHQAMNFVREQFMTSTGTRPSVFSHFTTATNTENIKVSHPSSLRIAPQVVFNACMESVFKQSTRATGLA
jgi:hypothetical protein